MQAQSSEYFPAFVSDSELSLVHKSFMLGTQELLALVRPLANNTEIAAILNLPTPRITEIFKGTRKLQLEEAKRLVEHFQLEGHRPSATSLPVAKMAVQHVALGLGLHSPDEQAVEDLARDLLAFLACALDPQWKGQIDVLGQILQGIAARRKAERAHG